MIQMIPAIVIFALAAHHGLAGFDQKKPVVLKGKITKLEWVNPHPWIFIDEPGSDGKITHWRVLFNSPNLLSRSGLSQKSFGIGTEVMVEGFQAVNSQNIVDATTITFKDGRTYFVRAPFFNDGKLILIPRESATQK